MIHFIAFGISMVGINTSKMSTSPMWEAVRIYLQLARGETKVSAHSHPDYLDNNTVEV